METQSQARAKSRRRLALGAILVAGFQPVTAASPVASAAQPTIPGSVTIRDRQDLVGASHPFQPPALTHLAPQTVLAGVAMEPLRVVNRGGGGLHICQAAALPAGLEVAVSADGTACDITGTPQSAQVAGDYVVQASNAYGNSSAVVNIEVQTPVFSTLWGDSGQDWDTAVLRDFTSVGYRQGDVALPDADDLPTLVDVTQFGARGNDEEDDSAAFVAAIDVYTQMLANGQRGALYVPAGRFILTTRIHVLETDHFVLRGAGMYRTELYFPLYVSEMEGICDVTECGGWPGVLYFRRSEEIGVEHLGVAFRDQRKGANNAEGHWEPETGHGIEFSRVTNGWIRDVRVTNADTAIMLQSICANVTVANIVLDHAVGRIAINGHPRVNGTVGHVGIAVKDSRYNLIHNVEVLGQWIHDFFVGAAKHNVFSKLRAFNPQIDHHGMNAHFNLWTDIDTNIGQRVWQQNVSQPDETYWNLRGMTKIPYPFKDGNVAVGLTTDEPSFMQDGQWYETLEPQRLHPQNLYLAQMDVVGKARPETAPVPLPVKMRGPTTQRLEAERWHQVRFVGKLRDIGAPYSGVGWIDTDADHDVVFSYAAPVAGTYDVTVRIKSSDGTRAMSLTVNDAPTGQVAQASDDLWIEQVIPGVPLKAGFNRIELVADQGTASLDFDYLDAVLVVP